MPSTGHSLWLWITTYKFSHYFRHLQTFLGISQKLYKNTQNKSRVKRINKKDGNVDKTIIEAKKNTGINEFFTTGDILTTLLEDVFSDIDIYKNNIHVLQKEFVSPLSSTQGIAFYRYFIADTLDIEGQRCCEVTFTPNNPQDSGFNGSL